MMLSYSEMCGLYPEAGAVLSSKPSDKPAAVGRSRPALVAMTNVVFGAYLSHATWMLRSATAGGPLDLCLPSCGVAELMLPP